MRRIHDGDFVAQAVDRAMRWERRGNVFCYYHPRRVVGRVVKDYHGSGPPAQPAADLVAEARDRRADRVRAREAERARVDELNEATAELDAICDLACEAAREAEGGAMHGSDAEEPQAVSAVEAEELRGLMTDARRGDDEALARLLAALDRRPKVRRKLGDLAAHVERTWIAELAGPDAALAEVLARKAADLRRELGGPYQTIPYTGHTWRPECDPTRQPHEYLRDGTAKALTLFHPADGRVRLEGVTACPNAVLHPWLKRELAEVLVAMPDPPADPAAGRRATWERWKEGLSIKPTLLAESPPLRMLLVLDNLAGHKTLEFVCRLFANGIMPLYTPVGGSWLNMAESLQRILERRALDGQYPTDTAQITAWYEAAERH